jgi:hypothetical protein
LPSTGPLPRLTAYAFASGRAKLSSVPAVEVDPGKLEWSGGRSNYKDLLDDTIVAAAPGVALTFTGIDGVFTDQPAAGGTLPSLARRYFGGADECIARVSSMSTSSRVVAPTCAKPSELTAGATPPGCEVPTSEQMAPTQLSCGGRDDLAAATGGLSPATMVLTRLDGVAAAIPIAPALELSALGSVPSYREAKLGPLCSVGPNPSVPSGGDPGTPGGSQTPSTEDPQPAPPHYSSNHDGCSSTAQVFADSCSGSSSSSSSSDGCSGDSSGSDDSCSGDSSSGSSGGCSGASDSADDGCSSSSSSSSSGCSGASSAADDGCRAARVRPRVRFSAGLYVLIALAAIARRFGRRGGYDRQPQGTCPEKTSIDVPAHE